MSQSINHDRKVVLLLSAMDTFLAALLYHFHIMDIVMLDTSHITWAILFVYSLTNLLFLYRTNKYVGRVIEWVSVTLVSLGLFGTGVGFFYSFHELFPDMNLTNLDVVKEIAAQLTNGVSIALISTIAGIATSVLYEFKRIWL